jgi:hypothetical protein
MNKALHSLCLAWMTVLVGACDSPSDEYCDAWCDCVGCDDAQRDACLAARDNDLSRAEEHGCTEQWENFVSCVADTYYCHEDELMHGCEAEEIRWTSCVD